MIIFDARHRGQAIPPSSSMPAVGRNTCQAQSYYGRGAETTEDHAAMRGIVWGLIFSLPFWLPVIL